MESYSGAPPTPPYAAGAAYAQAANPSAAVAKNPGNIAHGLFMAPRMNPTDGRPPPAPAHSAPGARIAGVRPKRPPTAAAMAKKAKATPGRKAVAAAQQQLLN